VCVIIVRRKRTLAEPTIVDGGRKTGSDPDRDLRIVTDESVCRKLC
jgi:hypothetical protein